MRQTITYAAIACLALASCKKDKKDHHSLSGTFKGTFERVEHARNTGPAPVTLTFNGNQYTGESTVLYYPAVCQGTYSIVENKGTFRNTCFWTANFDATLILDGEYDVTIKGDSVYIMRSYSGIVPAFDTYKLKKQDQ